MQNKFRVIGIDPGYDRNGVAVIEKDTTKDVLIFSTLITTEKKASMEERLFDLCTQLETIIKKEKPDVLAIEQLFLTNNSKTVIGVAQARGVILSLAGKYKLPVRELGPGQIKLAITGYGKADKPAVAMMVKKIIKLPERKMIDDEIDAIAVALTALAIKI
jgi:crossover junction endodeoxyribonuclease RuvC